MPRMIWSARWLLAVALFSHAIPEWVWAAAIGFLRNFMPMPSVVSIRPLVWAPMIALAGVVVIRFGTSMLTLRAVNPLLCVLMAYVAVSVLWSPDPSLSGKRAVLELGIALVCIALLASGYFSSWFPSVLRPTITVVVLLSIVVAIAVPGEGTENGAWQGILAHKNHLGQACVLCIVLWTARLRGDSSWMIWRALVIAASLVAIVFASTATAIVALIGVLGLVGVARTSKTSWMPLLFIGLILVFLVSHALGVTFGYPTPYEMVDWATGLVDREPNLTGRTDLWVYIWNEALSHPWFGTGYGAFWTGAYGGSTTMPSGWNPDQGHNVYLDIFNQLGIVGSILVALLFISHGRRLLALARTDKDLATLHSALFACVLVFGAAESVLFRGPQMWTVVLWVSMTEVSYLSYMNKELIQAYYMHGTKAPQA